MDYTNLLKAYNNLIIVCYETQDKELIEILESLHKKIMIILKIRNNEIIKGK